jgi:hypothetical protein
MGNDKVKLIELEVYKSKKTLQKMKRPQSYQLYYILYLTSQLQNKSFLQIHFSIYQMSIMLVQFAQV